MSPRIIAEFGSSPAAYHWDIEPWCAAATRAGASAAKIQLFRASHFPADEQSQKRPFEFPRRWLGEFSRLARAHDLMPGASVFDAEAVRLGITHLDFFKLAAREENNRNLIGQVTPSLRRLPVFRSVSRLKPDEFMRLQGMTTLYAVQKYPAPMVLSLWRLMQAERFFRAHGLRWGWSSHTAGILDCVVAARLGAQVIEKHLALARTDLEAKHSLLPGAFARMVKEIHKWQK